MKRNSMMRIRTKTIKSYLTLRQRITAAFTAAIMFLQICLPAVASAATAWGSPDDFVKQVNAQLNSSLFSPSGNSAYAYKGAFYVNYDAPNAQTLEGFYRSLTGAAGEPLVSSVGETFVQNRLIRNQIKALIGRFLLSPAFSLKSFDALESDQINQLYANGLKYGNDKKFKFGAQLSATETINADMIWPEIRNFGTADNPKNLLVPVVYLTSTTVSSSVLGNQIVFSGDSIFNGLTLNAVTLFAGRDSVINTTNYIINNGGKIQSQGNLTLNTAGTLANLSGSITAGENLNLIANSIINKTVVVPYRDQNGEGTRLGSIADINSNTGNVSIRSYSDITFEGATANANGTISFLANNNINLVPVNSTTQNQSQEGGWSVNKSTLELLQSRLSSEGTISLAAGGFINITASEIVSTRGGIELLAQQGIYILDEQGNTVIDRKKIKGRTKGTSSDFNSWAVRSVLDAGKGVLLDTEAGDVTLKAASINSADGLQVKARNGKVHLLITKEQSQHYLNTVRKGFWTIKTVNEQFVEEKGIPNAIVGGIAVEALQGVDIEYTGKAGSTLADQIKEYEKMPDMKWMATLYNNGQVNGNVNWSQVELAYKHISERNTSLSPAAMAIVAIAVAVAMGPSGMEWIGSNGGGSIGSAVFNATGSSSLAAAANAGALTLATAAAQNVAAGKNLEDTLKAITSDQGLKNLAISMATAGALNSDYLKDMDLFGAQALKATPSLAIVNQAYGVVINSVVTSGISVLVEGGNKEDFKKAFKQSLATNAINLLGEKTAGKISNSGLAEASKYIAHAAMGCLTASLTANINQSEVEPACFSGAAGAATGYALSKEKAAEIRSELERWALANGEHPENINYKTYEAQLNKYIDVGVDVSKLIVGLAAFAVGGDVNAGANGAATAYQSNRDNVFKAANLGGLMRTLGMIGCGNTSFEVCQANRVKDQVRENLKSKGKYSDLQIESAITKLETKGFFSAIGQFNTAFYNDGATIDDMVENLRIELSLGVPVGAPNNSGRVSPEILVSGVRHTVYQNAIFDTGYAAGEVIQTGEAIVGDVINAAFDTPIGQPIKAGLSWVVSKGKEVANEHEIIKDTAEKLDELSKLYGTGAFAYLYDRGYQDTKENIKDEKLYAEDATFVKGVSWIGNTITGFTAVKAASSSFKYIKAGEKSWRDVIPPTTAISRSALKAFFKEFNIPLKNGWDVDKLYDEVLSKPKGSRKLPSEYLSPEYIAAHLEKFEGGASRLIPEDKLKKYGPAGPDNTAFIMPKTEMDNILAEANGDPVKLARLLDVPDNTFVGVKLARVNIAEPEKAGLRLPDGNEGGAAYPDTGANKEWKPGGKLGRGGNEAVVIIDSSGEGILWTKSLLNF